MKKNCFITMILGVIVLEHFIGVMDNTVAYCFEASKVTTKKVEFGYKTVFLCR
jgi:hypothetical protein